MLLTKGIMRVRVGDTVVQVKVDSGIGILLGMVYVRVKFLSRVVSVEN